jgi:hypothetical protein
MGIESFAGWWMGGFSYMAEAARAAEVAACGCDESGLARLFGAQTARMDRAFPRPHERLFRDR